MQLHATQNCITEWSYSSSEEYENPFADITLDAIMSDASGREYSIPAFWAGDDKWSIRFAPPTLGEYSFHTVCSDQSNEGLHGREGTLIARPYNGDNPLLQHGFLRASENRRYLEHTDGTPFFWLADTWWFGLAKRLEWPGEFKMLLADRKAKGFNVIQIVAGLYPDAFPLDARGENEAGLPWDREYSRLNPAYFDMADLRIDWLARNGFVPCVVGAWGFFIHFTGIEAMKLHWRNIIARWGAYPVVWCVAGEVLNAYYTSHNSPKDREARREGWAQIAQYVREIDPYHHPITFHPGGLDIGRDCIDVALQDLNMLQTGHDDRASMKDTLEHLQKSYEAEPTLPFLNGEVCYEGIAEGCREEMQRFYFWVSVLSGACGHSYGANGLYQFSRRYDPFGPTPSGTAWTDTPWDEAYQLPGAKQIAIGKKLLERYEWWKFEPHPEWIEPRGTVEEPRSSYAAGIAGEVRIVYISNPWSLPMIKNLEPDIQYRAYLFDPRNGREQELSPPLVDAKGEWPFPKPIPVYHDWVLVMEKKSASKE